MGRPVHHKSEYGGSIVSRQGLREFIEDLVESLKMKDMDHVATLINREFHQYGIVVTPKDLK